MGACQSGEVTEQAWGDQPEMAEDVNEAQRVRINKKTDEPEDFEAGENQPEDNFFEFDEEIPEDEIKNFMAVKPWIGAVKEPDNHPEVDSSQPAQTLCLEYVYGYRCQDSRQNVYFNPDGNICYMTACLGVILDKEANTQTFFGGGEVENASKQVASDRDHHNNDIMCLKVNVNGDRQWAVSGQVGKSPSVFVWNTQTGEKKHRFKLNKNSRQVSACAISPDCKFIATADACNDHVITIFDLNDGTKMLEEKSGPDMIFDLAFSQKEGCYDLWSAGIKHFAQWAVGQRKRKGIFGDNPRTSMACVTADDRGRAFSGGANALVYVWNGTSIAKTIGCHGKGFVGAITWVGGVLYSGGSDGKVCIIDCDTLEPTNAIQFPALPRALDAFNGNLVVGLRTGSIVQANMETGDMTTLMQSHNSGEVWGLSQDGCNVYTSGDDNQVKVWDPLTRTCVSTGIVNAEGRMVKKFKNRASSLSKYPSSQQARAVSISPNGHICVCANDGSVTIRDKADSATVIKEITDPKEWIETAEYSPSGKYLAIGSHDTNIYVYDVEADYSLVGKCSKHNASISCIDWSQDETYIRSVCNAYELLFFTIPSCDQDPYGASSTTGTIWQTQHCKFGWLVDGIFPKGTDGTHINGVDMNPEQTLISCGDDYGLVQLFRNPARKGVQPRSFRGHSEHVVRVRFGTDGLAEYLFSVGGYDQTVMQWKICDA